MAEDFRREIRNAGKEGNLNKVIELLNKNSLSWQPAWIVKSINEWDQEQERVLLLTNEAYYRVKYNFKDAGILRSRKQPLSDIIRIYHGYFYCPSNYSLTALIKKDEISQQYGLRIFTKKIDGRKNPKYYLRSSNGIEFYRTYRAIPSKNATINEKDTIEEIAAAFASADDLLRTITGTSKFYVSFTSLRRENPGGLFSLSYNSLQLGMWNKE